MARLLLHICCGPCATACVERLREEGHDVTLFFSNANIAPEAECEKRLETARKFADAVGVPLVADEGASHADWLREVASGLENEPEGGRRCRRCFEFNLRRAAAFARANGFEALTTSLTVSPHKRSETVFEAGRAAAPDLFVEENFKKRDGFKRSLALSQALGLYRQDYCGCEFSRRPSPSTSHTPAALPSQGDGGADLDPLPHGGHAAYMRLALDEAAKAAAAGEVPTGCVIVEAPDSLPSQGSGGAATDPLSPGCRILATARNRTEELHDPTAHAEILAIRQAAAARGDFRLDNTILYVTKEPCAMCAGAIVLARIPLVVWGVDDERRGGESVFGILTSEALIHRAALVRGVLGDEARAMLQGFFKERRAESKRPSPNSTQPPPLCRGAGAQPLQDPPAPPPPSPCRGAEAQPLQDPPAPPPPSPCRGAGAQPPQDPPAPPPPSPCRGAGAQPPTLCPQP